MKTIKNEMIKLFALSGAGLLILLYISYKSVTYFLVNQEYQKARLLAHTLVYTRDYVAKVAPYVVIKNKHFHPFSLTPAYVVSQITTLIKNGEHFEIKQTSDRYRDPKNKPNIYDLQAINFFKKHPDKEEYFNLKTIDNKEYLFYAYPLITEKSCLKCHGPVNEIPKPLYEKLVKYYGKKAFGYKEGELRGVISIRLPFDEVKAKIDGLFKKLALFLLIIYVIGVIIFLRINSLVLKDVEKINKFMKENLSKNRFRPLKEKFYFNEMEEIKEHINEVVSAVKMFKKDSYSGFYYHPLSKLPNRTKLIEVLKRKNASILLFDIDSFKEINYYYGEEIADKLIQQVVKRIEKYKPFHTKIDQFAILVSQNSKEEIKKIAKEILHSLEKPYHIEGIDIYVKFRVGISYEKKEFKEALNALEATKILNRDIVFGYEIEHLKEISKQHVQMIKKLKIAIEKDKLIPFYQPIFDKDEKVCKYEALIRLIDENGHVYTPYYFLDVAKKSRLYFEITKQIVKKSFDKFRNLDYSLSINLTTLDMENEYIKNFILDRLSKFPNPQRVSFEIVESEDIKHSVDAQKFIKELKTFGCKILIDDFGSGYANFDYLLSLNADSIKIDGSLIKNILNDKNSQIIVRTIVSFAKEADMQVIAEFIENKETFEYLKSMNIDCFQGYYFSPPKEDLI
jgi:EAL domain-containing protein (putative c-di-GMP-specific phosphodiesterase class I)/GGDEF domain-containing protein